MGTMVGFCGVVRLRISVGGPSLKLFLFLFRNEKDRGSIPRAGSTYILCFVYSTSYWESLDF